MTMDILIFVIRAVLALIGIAVIFKAITDKTDHNFRAIVIIILFFIYITQ